MCLKWSSAATGWLQINISTVSPGSPSGHTCLQSPESAVDPRLLWSHYSDLVPSQKPPPQLLLLPCLLQVSLVEHLPPTSTMLLSFAPIRAAIVLLLSCSAAPVFRLVGVQQWTTMDTHSNKSSYRLAVLKPDTTYQVKVLTQCLHKLHKTNEVITIRTPEGCECHMTYLHPDAATFHFDL